MGVLDFVRNLFGKKEPPPASPSEQESQRAESVDGQFATPQNPAETPQQPPSTTATGQAEPKGTSSA